MKKESNLQDLHNDPKGDSALHKDHRTRMRERGLRDGYECFADHELLEMLLYYSIPRGDTNKTAHLIMEQFGSLSEVLEASFDALLRVQGMGDRSAALFLLIRELIRRFYRETESPGKSYNTVQAIAEYVWPRFLGLTEERLYMLLFNNCMNLLDCMFVSTGDTSGVPANLHRMYRRCVEKGASHVVLAHNHPHGKVFPSAADVEVTNLISLGFFSLGVPLLEHLIIAEDRFFPIVKNCCGEEEDSEVRRLRLSAFDCLDRKSFYNTDENQYRFSIAKGFHTDDGEKLFATDTPTERGA